MSYAFRKSDVLQLKPLLILEKLRVKTAIVLRVGKKQKMWLKGLIGKGLGVVDAKINNQPMVAGGVSFFAGKGRVQGYPAKMCGLMLKEVVVFGGCLSCIFI